MASQTNGWSGRTCHSACKIFFFSLSTFGPSLESAKNKGMDRNYATAGFTIAGKDAAVEHPWLLLADELLTATERAEKVEGFRKEA